MTEPHREKGILDGFFEALSLMDLFALGEWVAAAHAEEIELVSRHIMREPSSTGAHLFAVLREIFRSAVAVPPVLTPIVSLRPDFSAAILQNPSISAEQASLACKTALASLCNPSAESEEAADLSHALVIHLNACGSPPGFASLLMATLSFESLKAPPTLSRAARSHRFLRVLLATHELSEKQVLQLAKLPLFDGHGTVTMLEALAPSAPDVWLAAFRSADWETRSSLARAAVEDSVLMKDSEIRSMIRSIGHRELVHPYLAHVQGEEWRDFLLQMLELDPAGIREALATGSLESAGALAPQDLLPLLNHSDPNLRSIGFQLLGKEL